MFLTRSDKLAIVDFDNSHINYNELIANIKYYSDIFPKIDNEDHIILMMENRKEWIYSFFAIWDRKLAPVVIDALSNKDELKYFVKDSNSKKVIVSNKNYEVAKLVKQELKQEDYYIEIINIDEIIVDEEKIRKYINEDIKLNNPDLDNTAIMMYTSGTTSQPKGVMLTYKNITSEIESIKSFDIDDREKLNDQVLVLLPLHHILPLMVTCLYFLNLTHSIVLLKNLTSKDILETLSRNKITIFVGVPRVYKLFYQSIKNTINSKFITKFLYNLAKKINSKAFSKLIFKKVHNSFGGHIKYLLSGGAKSDPEMIEFFNTLGFTYCEGYGLTETSPVFLGSVPKHYKLGTVGKKVDNVEIKIVDEELWVKGPIVMKGYYNKPEKTKEVLTDDGWFKTGDLVSVDNDGFISIVGRKNSMIVLSNGKNIEPEMLEEKLLSRYKFGVKEAALLKNNDKLCAIIVVDIDEMKKNNILNINTYIQDGIEYYNSQVHNYAKILEYKIFDTELPKTRIGKIRRFMLNDMYNLKYSNEKNKKDENEPDFNEYKLIKQFIKKIKDIDVYKNDTFEIEIGLDSLDLVEMITYIESNFNLKLDEKLISIYNTPLKLSEYIKENSSGYIDKDTNWKEIIDNVEITNLKKNKMVKYIKYVIKFFFKLYFRLSAKNMDKIPNKQKIYISNHQSFIDAPSYLSYLDDDTYFLAIDIHFKNKIMKFIGDNSNIILIDIEKNVKDSIEKIVNVLKQNKNIFIFPEGSRTKDGNILKFKKIFAILAKEMNIDIQCLKINGAYEAYSRHMILPRPKKVEIEYIGEIKPIGTYEEIVSQCENLYNKN